MKESLLFCYDIATQDTPLAGSKLLVNEVPMVIYCAQRAAERELPGVQSFRCHSSRFWFRPGLIGMRERADMLNAEFHLQTSLGNGTQTTVAIPYEHRADYPS
jgi:hypothetical protein